MAESQAMRARQHLVCELHAGTRPPGAHISVKDIAAKLRISHIPVREALARLAGEGAVTAADNRQGYTVPRFSPAALIETIDFSRLMIEAASHDRAEPTPETIAPTATDDPVPAIEAVMSWMTQRGQNYHVRLAISRVGLLLAPYRRAEARVLPDWLAELKDLADRARDPRWQPVSSSYWRRRIEVAAKLIDAVEYQHHPSNIFQI